MIEDDRERIAAQPGPQTSILEYRDEFELFAGGSRWGGKTYGMLLDWLTHMHEYGHKAQGVMLRRTFKELESTIQTAHELFPKMGGVWSCATDSNSTYIFENGARLRFRHLDNDADASKFLGHFYTRLYIEEAGEFPSPKPIFKLMATLQVPDVKCGIRLTSNPGGPGTSWLRSRYITPAPKGNVLIPTEYEIPDPRTGNVIKVVKNRMFIPTYTHNNSYRFTGENVANLYESTSDDPLMRRAWVDGSFDVQLGQFFPEFDITRHVIAPFEPEPDWLRFFVLDWGGGNDPTALTWWTVVGDGYTCADGAYLPRGAMVCYREIYLCRRKENGEGTNSGLGLSSDDVAEIIIDAERHEPKNPDGFPDIKYRESDTKLFAVDAGPPISERMARGYGLRFRSANRKRVSRMGVPAGWDYLKSRLVGVDRRPMIYWFSTCIDSIRTIPDMQHDKDNPGDMVSKRVEDHLADCARYAVMSRPWIQSDPLASMRPADPEKFDTQAGPVGIQISADAITEMTKELEDKYFKPPPNLRLTGRSRRIW